MLSLRLDPDLERVLERDVDDLARYNILRFVHDNLETQEDVQFFAEKLGLRSVDRVEEALEARVKYRLLERTVRSSDGAKLYSISRDPGAMDLVDRLYSLSGTSIYGEIVERLAARSLHRARRSQPLLRTEY